MNQPWKMSPPTGLLPKDTELRSIQWGVPIDEDPPSANELYTTHRGKRILTSKGRRFHSQASELIRRRTELDPEWSPAVELFHRFGGWVELSIGLTLPASEVLNSTWLKSRGELTRTEKGTLRIPYQRRDTSNMTKVVEDAVAIGTGIDDAAHASVHVYRLVGKKTSVHVSYLLVFAIDNHEED